MKSGTSSNSAEHRISLSHALADHRKLLLLTGAGISTDSGIPAYRDNHGDWKHSKPVQARDFYQSAAVRKRYWARSLNGWPLIAGAKPNRAHQLAAELEQSHRLQYTITQNVDGLHQRAGSNRVVDLHGNLSMVHCLSCGAQLSRAELQGHLITRNPYFVVSGSQPAPDGDAQFNADSEEFNVVDCQHCGGALKPDVVFYGENVPKTRVEYCYDQLDKSDALVCVGSSLMVYSAFRFCRHAAASGKPIIIVNLGTTRADELASCKLHTNCVEGLEALQSYLANQDQALP